MKKQALTAFLPAFIFLFTVGTSALSFGDVHYPIGEVVQLEGSVKIIAEKSQKEVSETDPVFMNSVVETGPDSKVLILLIDDTQLTLGENSELLIDEYVFDPYDATENKAEFSVPKGTISWISGMISKREDPQVKINTAIGSIGIRGTQFWAGNIEDGYGVFVSDGLVQFNGNWGSVDIPKDSGVFISPNPANPPSTDFWNQSRIDIAKERVSFKVGEAAIQQKLEQLGDKNIQRRHDYRGQMFPYKENPYAPKLKQQSDEFFTDEFEELRNKN